MNSATVKTLTTAVAATLLFAGCGGGGSEGTGGTGELSIGVTDAPVDEAAAVVVKFTGVELKPENGNAFTIDLNPDKSIDLLALSGGQSVALLDDQTVEAGRYEWIRLLIEAEQNQPSSYIDLSTGERFPLHVPSGSETGLKLVRGFTVAVGGRTDFTIDFDLRKSVIAPPGQSPNYVLKPALRIVDNLQVGTIAGTVSPALVNETCTPFVYVFSGSAVVPDDLDNVPSPDVDPLISVPVELDSTSGEWRYRVAFVEAGPYTVSFTCGGALDTPEGDEVLTFVGTVDAGVTSGQTTTVAFVP
jgi:hypothetical protein